MSDVTPLAELHRDLKQLIALPTAAPEFRADPDFVPEARRIAIAAAAPGGEEGHHRVRALLRPIQRRALYLSRALVRRTARQADALARLLDVIRAFRDEALPRLGEARADILGETENDLAWCRRLLLRNTERLGVVRELGDRVDDTLVEKLGERIARSEALERPGFALARLLGTEVELRARDQGEQARRIAEIREDFWRRIEASAAERGGGVKRWLDELFDDVADKGADAMAQTESLDFAPGLHLLELACADVERSLALCERYEVRHRRRELKRMRRRLEATLQDREVRMRQVERVGPRGLRVVEISIVVFIVGVMVILAWLSFGNPSQTTRWVLAWIDAGICVGLLTDFGWRLSLARDRFRYFRRYLLTDVLPSLPFGLISEFILAAHGVGGQDRAASLRILKASRVLRGLRLLRPLMQAYRLTAFAVQGMDRMVRRYGDLLNRNVILFDQGPATAEPEETFEESLRRLDHRVGRALRLSLTSQEPEVIEKAILRCGAAQVQRLDAARDLEVHLRQRTRSDFRDLRMERLIEGLITVDVEAVEDRLGEEGARRIARFIGIFDIPVARSLPVLRQIVPGLSEQEPFDALRTAGHRLGVYLDRRMDRLRFLGDLMGIITGPQLLDRLGAALVRMTQRPAVRLLLLGILMLLLSGLVALVGSPPEGEGDSSLLWSLHEFFSKVLGTPLIVLGSICLVIQAFGRWIRHLAGEASDRFQKVAEAQGINLLKFEKLGHRREDLDLLYDRSLGPEVDLLGRAPDVAAERESFREQLPHRPGEPVTFPEIGAARTQVMMLYQDYLDGAILHRSNTKSTEQFLGNLDIEAIRRDRLRVRSEDEKELDRLDLMRDRALPTGPSLWFRFITESLAEKTAKLVLEYSRMAIPLGHLPLVPEHARDLMRRWVDRELPITSLRTTNEELLTGSLLASTHFNSLHFMTADPRRDAHVAAEFGPDVLARLRDDRRTMIREVFGTYPFEDLPRARRTFNPYDLYFHYLGGGRALLLPLRVLWAFLVVTGRGIRRFARLVREQLHPEIYRRDPRARWAPFPVAVRKLNRMRRPIFMAALELRSRFDPEYLGAPLPGRGAVAEGEDELTRDLDLIGAREHERDRFRRRREDTIVRMRVLEERLRRGGWPEVDPARALAPELPPLDDQHRNESLRAIAIAWNADFQGCRTKMLAEDEVTLVCRQLLNQPGDLKRRRLRSGVAARRPFVEYLARSPFRNAGGDERALLWAAYAANHRNLRTRILSLRAAGGPVAAEKAAVATLAREARYPMPWSRQLVTLRAVQTITILDILNSRRLIHDLGRYGEDGDVPPAS